MPDLGTARTDFPGASAATLYESIKKILSLPEETRVFMCHDYPPPNRFLAFLSNVKEENQENSLIHEGISKEEYVLKRHQKDQGKAVPKLLFPSIQVNLRAGQFGNPEQNNTSYIKIPIDIHSEIAKVH